MRKIIYGVVVSCFLHLSLFAQTPSIVERSSKETVEAFFTAFGKGDYEGIINTFSDDARIIAVNDTDADGATVYGSYTGIEGLKKFLGNLGESFDTQAFSVDHIVGEGDIAFAKGSFVHRVKATDKLFESDWALMCRVEEGRITSYHFFEDSAAFLKASQ